MDLGLKDKVILVAGASKGLGYGIAEALIGEGAKVSIASRTANDINAAAKKLCSDNVISYVADVTDVKLINGWVQSTLNHFGRIDGLVVNAGGPPAGSFDSFDDQAWESAFNNTLLSSVRLIREVLPVMKKNRSGSILTITSSAVKEPISNLILSNVFRSGVLSLVKTLSNELAANNIRVNNIVPGRIDTDRVRQLDTGNAKRFDESLEQHIARQQSEIPLGRYGTIQEFGATAAFLLSERASYITGATVVVDGGKTKSVF